MGTGPGEEVDDHDLGGSVADRARPDRRRSVLCVGDAAGQKPGAGGEAFRLGQVDIGT